MEAFQKEDVLKDLDIKMPASQLKVQYGDIVVEPGMVLTPTQVKDQPHLEWNADPDALYAVVMNDPDAPSRENPRFREWHHWCMVNIPGGNVSQGEALSEYVGSGPPKGTGLHRYVFLVFKQVGKINFNEPHLTNRSADGRASHKASGFAKKYKFGTPVAGNFYQAEWDDYVPKLYDQLSGK